MLPVADQLTNFRVQVPIILCFKLDGKATHNKIIQNLVTGLSHTLVDVPFLAGRVVPEEGNNGRVSVTIGSEAGVTFKVCDLAAAGTQPPAYTYDELEAVHFASSVLDSFLPVLAPRRVEDLDEPVLHIEANFVHGGLLLAFCIHHSTSDASAWSRVLRTWSAHTKAAAGKSNLGAGRLDPKALDRSPLFGLDNPFVLAECPQLKAIDIPNSIPQPRAKSHAENPLDRTSYEQKIAVEPLMQGPKPVHTYWYISVKKLQLLKDAAHSATPTDPWVSTSDALFALIWRRMNVAKGLLDDGVDSSTFWVPVDFRSRLDLHPDYMGNAMDMALATSPMAELCSSEPNSLYKTAARIRDAVNAIDRPRVQRTLALMDSMRPDSFTYDFDMVSGAGYCTTSFAKYDWFVHDWGCDLGKIKRARYQWQFLIDGFAMVSPKFEDGGMEIAITVLPKVLGRLKVDREFTKYVEFRCC
ncbi:hypothetical protein K432DRAFT_326299 [Lepidopterella palustris CBS 459.81]|uniref:Uncharacterized protein n=1 Tax=Lepidopterella palustris CBS 459.81 TaxID=1314670 RepID=A0A8E2ECC8_9PEZI|nr:hypothetical protein K432DRAFT_326299 [Lepidopterella palustris CBS 459.81]